MKYQNIALIPSYQPEKILLTLTKELLEKDIQVIVINDGSDQNNHIYNQLDPDVILLQHSTNLGKGAALKTGIRYVEQHFEKPYHIVCVDGDGQHHINDVIALLHTSNK